MLWDIIRDFIVEHITGGYVSDGTIFAGFMGYDGEGDNWTTDNFIVKCGQFAENEEFLTFGDWLATTITAVIMILLVVFAVWFVRWIFKAVSSAFLLK